MSRVVLSLSSAQTSPDISISETRRAKTNIMLQHRYKAVIQRLMEPGDPLRSVLVPKPCHPRPGGRAENQRAEDTGTFRDNSCGVARTRQESRLARLGRPRAGLNAS